MENKNYKFMIILTDTKENLYLELSNSVLVHRTNYVSDVDCKVLTTRDYLDYIFTTKFSMDVLINDKIKMWYSVTAYHGYYISWL